MEEIRLRNLKKGKKAIVSSLQNANPALRKRLLDMGFTRGAEVEIKKVAPLGDPVNVIIRGYDLCIRKADMENIMVRVLEA